jgi:hypothetical protein
MPKNLGQSMPKPFVERFRKYLIHLTQVMQSRAVVSSIFPNPTDNGQIKEHIFLDLLNQHHRLIFYFFAVNQLRKN